MIKQFQGEYRWLSNFYPCKIIYKDLEFLSVENAYQAAKFDDYFLEEFTKCTAAQAKKLGKSTSPYRKIRNNWNDIKEQIMKQLCFQKFNQEAFKSKLLATKNEEIQEGNNWGDIEW